MDQVVVVITTHLDLVADLIPITDILDHPLIIDPRLVIIETLVLDQDHESIVLGEKQIEDLLILLIAVTHHIDLNIDQLIIYHLLIVNILMKFSCFFT